MKRILIIILFVLITVKANAQIVTDIYNVQQDATLIGKQVAVLGIVTAGTGIFHQQVTFIEDSDGGPWSGIVIRDRNANFSAAEGDKTRIIGTVVEHNDVTEILVDQYYYSTKNNQVTTVKVKTTDLATGSPTAESYESVLVQVDSVTVVNDNAGNGEWLVDDGSGACRIGSDSNYLLYDIPAIGTEIRAITGILDFSDGQFKLQPRNRADILDSASLEYNIQTIQQSSSLIGKIVTTSGIVTAATGIFHPEKTYIEEPDGGPWSGILLWDNTATLQFNEGDRVRVTGEVVENNGLTSISLSSHEILSTGNPLPPTEVVTTADISAKAESYESVLVKVFDVYIANNNSGNGEWEIDDIAGACSGQRNLCRIGNDAVDFTYTIPPVGTPLISIQGILTYGDGKFKLEPRYQTDIRENQLVPIGDTLTIIQRPLINIPTILQPGDTLEILCDLSTSPTLWKASLIYKNREIWLVPLDHNFNEHNGLWSLKAILPQIHLFELYDLKLEIVGQDIDIEKNAVQVIPDFKDDFYFIHVTDTHLPRTIYCRDGGYQQDTSEVNDFRAVIEDINLINPAFVLHTGDLVHEGELEDYCNNRYYSKAKQMLAELDVPVYLVSGNHDLGGWDDTPMSDGTARRDWWRFFGWKFLNEPPGSDPQYTQDYTFNYGNCFFIGMEAYLNYDRWRSDIYGYSSFINNQLTWLNNKLDKVDNSKLKILFYHYDFNNDLDLNNLGIDLSLWGHAHQDIGSIYEYPYNLCTDACCYGRRAYRLIRIQGNTIKPTLTINAGRNGENLRITYTKNTLDSMTTTIATVTNQTPENFENALIKFSISPGRIFNIQNGTLLQIDSLTTPWTAYVQTSLPGQSTTQVEMQYLTVGIDKFESKPNTFSLEQNYPNPFNSSTRFNYSIRTPGNVIIEIANIQGQQILKKELGYLDSGSYSFVWNTLDNKGNEVPTGTYFYSINSHNCVQMKKMILLR